MGGVLESSGVVPSDPAYGLKAMHLRATVYATGYLANDAIGRLAAARDFAERLSAFNDQRTLATGIEHVKLDHFTPPYPFIANSS